MSFDDAGSVARLRSVVIAGGNGGLGRRIADDLTGRGLDVAILTRTVDPTSAHRQIAWDGRTQGPWVDALDGGDTALINLAGKLVDCRPTPTAIAELRSSRVDPTLALVDAARTVEHPLTHWIQASTTAIWSDAGETWCTEDTPLPTDGLPQMTGVAEPWEAAASGARCDHLVVLRTSIVLDTDSPVLQRLTRLTRVGLGGPIAGGRQWISWIHIDDWLAIVRAGLGLDPDVSLPSGVVVAATDNPVRNADLMATLRRLLHRPWAPPTPEVLLRIGAVALRTDPQLGLTGRRARSRVLADAGFDFRHPHLEGALADLLV